MKLLDYQSDASRGGKFRLGKHFGKQARAKSERVSLVIIALLLQKIANAKCLFKNFEDHKYLCNNTTRLFCYHINKNLSISLKPNDLS